MNITIKNIVICILIIIVTYMAFDTILNILKINYTLKLIKEEAAEPLKDYDVYADLSIVLKKYFRCIRNLEYDKLKDMSLFYAKKTNEEYKDIADTLAMSELFEIVFNNIYVMDSEIYLCNMCIKSSDTLSKNMNVVVKLNREKGFFRILNITFEGEE